MGAKQKQLEVALRKLEAELECRKQQFETEITPLRGAIADTTLQLAEAKFDCKVGDVIIYDGKTYRISGFYSGYMWPQGNLQKKDGTFSTQCANLYNYKGV
jgi:hypothetical protein